MSDFLTGKFGGFICQLLYTIVNSSRKQATAPSWVTETESNASIKGWNWLKSSMKHQLTSKVCLFGYILNHVDIIYSFQTDKNMESWLKVDMIVNRHGPVSTGN